MVQQEVIYWRWRAERAKSLHASDFDQRMAGYSRVKPYARLSRSKSSSRRPTFSLMFE